MPIKVLHVGLGPIGAGVVRQVAARKGFTIVGAVDIDPAKVGQDLGQVCGVGRKLRVKVTDDIARTIKATRPDVAVLCTSSSLKKVVPEFEAVLKLKVPIVSTTEAR
jgi:4-hydroxy-tetrahydrodipicolinate reductase